MNFKSPTLPVIAAATLLFISCFSDRKVLNSWLEHNIKEVIERLGPAAQVIPYPEGGEGEHIYVFSSTSFGAGIYAGTTFYTYVFFYTSKMGTIYNWMEKKGSVPPQQVNVDLYIHH